MFTSDGSDEKYYLNKNYWSEDINDWNHIDYSSDFTNSPEYIDVKIDASNNILESITNKGVKQINIPVETKSSITYSDQSQEYIEVKIDASNNILESRNSNGIKKEHIGLETHYIEFEGNQIRSTKSFWYGSMVEVMNSPNVTLKNIKLNYSFKIVYDENGNAEVNNTVYGNLASYNRSTNEFTYHF
jgi:hypothetical protein